MTPERVFAAATLAYPYYARGFAALTPVQTPGIPTAGVDAHWRLYYSDPEWRWARGWEAQALRHELEHLLRDHAGRVGTRDAEAWNVAADAEINDDIPGLPAWAVTPKTLGHPDGLTAERYYAASPSGKSGKSGQSPQSPQSPQSGQTCSGGSGVDGVPRPHERGAPATPDDGVAQADADVLRDAVAADIVAHAATHPGTVPGEVVAWASARARGRAPKMSWRILVRRRITALQAGRHDYSFARLSRRQTPGAGPILPGSVRPTPRVLLIADTSGSTEQLGDRICGAARDLAARYRCDILAVDAAVHGRPRPAHPGKIVSIFRRLRGGGGTDLRVASAHCARYDAVIALTDGETPWPSPWPRNFSAVVFGDGEKIAVLYGPPEET